MSTPLGPPIDARPYFAPERRALLELLASLAPGDWSRPTVCPGWTVQDVAADLLGDDLGRLARTRDGAGGLARAGGESILAFIDRINEEWLVAARRLSPRVLMEQLAFTGPQIEELWAGLPQDAMGPAVTWAGPGAAPVWLDCARDLSEYWTHRQQVTIATAAGAPDLGPPDLVATVVDTFLRALPHTLRPVDASDGTEVAFVVTGPGGGRWTAARRQDGWWLGTGAGAGAGAGADESRSSATVVLDTDTVWRLATRAIGPDQAQARAQIAGELRLAAAMLELRAAIV